MIVWPYTDLGDRRLRFGRRYITLRQDATGRPIKIGLAQDAGWGAYYLEGTLFVKRFPWLPAATYPDDGCNLELFSNSDMLELESLGPLVVLQHGQTIEHREDWELCDGLSCDPNSDDEIDGMINRAVPRFVAGVDVI